MSWADLAPIIKTVPNVKASMSINNDQIPRITLSFSEPFFREMGEPERCSVQAGTGDMLGKIRIVFGDGPFNLKEIAKGGGKFQIPAPQGLPARVREIEPCEILEKPEPNTVGPGVLIIGLPLEAWSRQAAPVAVAVAAPAKPVQAAVGRPVTAKIDAATYLRAKGLKCSRMAGDYWQLQGQRIGREVILKKVNEFRRAAEPPEVQADGIE